MPESATKPDPSAVETKLAAARTRLILDKPFLGALVLRLPLKPADSDWCQTTATDAKSFYFNPDYIASLTLEQTQFILAHEALHCALSHFARRQHRIKHRWDLACDHAINPLLIDDGLIPPHSALAQPRFKGLTAEEIYPLIDEEDPSETLDQHLYDQEERSNGSQPEHNDAESNGRRNDQDEGDKGRLGSSAPAVETDNTGSGAPEPRPLSASERETLATQWRQRLAGAAQQALQAGKLGGEMARMIDHLLQPQLPWRMLLARYLTAHARDDYDYYRPSRREGDFILPRLHSHQMDLVVAIDTSGSIRDGELDDFMAEIDALKGQVRARVTLLPCDARLDPGAPFHFEPWDAFQRPARLAGGGGTHFTPVFDWIADRELPPDLLVYFTDANGEFPEREPTYPVIWLVKGRAPVPWGQRIQLN
ncbi:Protein of unknown function DUF2201, metallopeptidase-related [Thiorhodococcus drewsii AZ1]|uniref:Metallopeptidase domain-containing protein n=1 Tax=Thiorhodococcus drewsii AZ1 TaxID=765913 RepID=G2E2L9_9GAMM|nr:VWA-like domain-containing protein [Thiorhodococcus drewsii]EGV30573.1 Protein of unknown function DUF2201, metallopeptidase-related [Thiorhodococcus drewsii AZ1]